MSHFSNGKKNNGLSNRNLRNPLLFIRIFIDPTSGNAYLYLYMSPSLFWYNSPLHITEVEWKQNAVLLRSNTGIQTMKGQSKSHRCIFYIYTIMYQLYFYDSHLTMKNKGYKIDNELRIFLMGLLTWYKFHCFYLSHVPSWFIGSIMIREKLKKGTFTQTFVVISLLPFCYGC